MLHIVSQIPIILTTIKRIQIRSNELVWNPMEAFVFAVANEDYNTYAFDLR